MSMLFGTSLGRLSGGYKASLVARVHMRLGNWRKTVMPKEVRSSLESQKTPCHLYLSAGLSFQSLVSVLAGDPAHQAAGCSFSAMLQDVSEEAIEQVKTNLHIAIQTAPDWSKAWHSWALFNAQMLEY